MVIVFVDVPHSDALKRLVSLVVVNTHLSRSIPALWLFIHTLQGLVPHNSLSFWVPHLAAHMHCTSAFPLDSKIVLEWHCPSYQYNHVQTHCLHTSTRTNVRELLPSGCFRSREKGTAKVRNRSNTSDILDI
ncbi:hypothetical protein TRVL_10289 [Trypanosoma vivax]|nr:hypothetical protein TRVL_10289 [Trypanosoma vivax]